ncbi:response regulator [Nitrincola sp. MINF-07-Sa-05]|uniref:response regulator n=1 Tax=Nitrincola salilacus TaxID=3400273 RepID=UPI003917EAFB
MIERLQGLTARSSYKWFISVMALLSLVAVAITFTMIVDRQQRLIDTVRDDALWASFQLEREVSRLSRQLEKYFHSPSSQELDEGLLLFEVLYGRQEILNTGHMNEFYASDPRLTADLEYMTAQIKEMDALLDEVMAQEPEALQKFNQLIESVLAVSKEFLLTTLHLNRVYKVDTRDQLIALLTTLSISVSVLALLTLAIIVLLFRSMLREKQLRIEAVKLAGLLKEEAEHAQGANKAKTDFLAVMSHELRTPMNGVLGMTELLLEKQIGSDERELANDIYTSAESLMRLLNDLLDLSRMEAGKFSLVSSRFSLADLCRRLYTTYNNAHREKPITFDLELDSNLRQAYIGDPARIRQVLINLLSNAFKFTERGRIRLNVSLTEPQEESVSADTRQWLRIEVEDTGIGIAEETQSRLFNSFVQADSSISRQYGGTGLGLAICRNILQNIGGEIGVNSHPGEGSCFWFILPLKPASSLTLNSLETEPELEKIQSVVQSNHQGEGQRVLVAEDQAINRKLLVTFLDQAGYEVEVACNGQEALDKVRQGDYDLILMDLQMPVMDGLDATQQIRALGGALSSIPIIGVTANAMAADREACRKAGMNGFVSKPIDRQRLLRMCREVRADSDWLA